jgi:NAD(P)H-flavin reductase
MPNARVEFRPGEDEPSDASEPRREVDEGSRFEIVARQDFSDATYLIEIRHPMMAKAARAGQFVIVISHEHGERIPLTIADFDREAGTVTLVIQALGKTTREMQRNCQVGTRLYSVTGPMGLPIELGDAEKVVFVGGGLGVAPIFPLARAFKEGGAYVIGIVGFRTKELAFWEDKFKKYCDEFIICTDDGSWPSTSTPISTSSSPSARQ